jgi:hypothetical protein
LKGNLAPGGAVAKITGKEGLEFTGKARTFDTEDAFVEAVEKGEIKKGEKTVAVLRYLGPKGGPGESVSHDLLSSTVARLGIGVGNWGVRYKRVSPLRTFSRLPCVLAVSVLRRPFLSSPPFFPFFHFVGEDGCGIASIDGAPNRCSVGSHRGLVFLMALSKPKITRICGSPGATEHRYRVYGQEILDLVAAVRAVAR